MQTEDVEEGATLEDYQSEDSYGAQLRDALESGDKAGQEEEGGSDSLEKDENIGK